MYKPDAAYLLQQLILLREGENLEEGKRLKIQFHAVYESLKPINVLKSTLNEAAALPDLKSKVINAVAGAATDFVAKKLAAVNSGNPLMSILSTFARAFTETKNNE